jgi:hypothetical protein
VRVAKTKRSEVKKAKETKEENKLMGQMMKER